ncbi:Glycosyl hydrolase family 57 [Candidatus Methanoperedenaceae archaeon GB50]|nr:Glycosyl hydrolase family 57 [Candidatus Methanoperedenaceae archaeon GB50]
MRAVCLCFQVHQPFRLRWFWPIEGYESDSASLDLYFDQGLNRSVFEEMSEAYIRLNRVIQDRGLKCTFNLSGTLLDQSTWNPELIRSFRKLRGVVEFLSSPYYNSLASLFEEKGEFVRQVRMQRDALSDLLGVRSTVFVNTELIHNSVIARLLRELGFSAVLSEGGFGLGERSSLFDDDALFTLFRHPVLSEDLEFRAHDTTWCEYPLTASKFAGWIAEIAGDLLTLYVDYGCVSDEFLGDLVDELGLRGIDLLTVSEAISEFDPSFYDGALELSRLNLKHCLSNHMQHLYLHELERLSRMGAGGDKIFGYLQQADIFFEMGDGKPYPFDYAVNALSILSDYARRRV